MSVSAPVTLNGNWLQRRPIFATNFLPLIVAPAIPLVATDRTAGVEYMLLLKFLSISLDLARFVSYGFPGSWGYGVLDKPLSPKGPEEGKASAEPFSL